MSSLWASCRMSYFAFVRWWIYNQTGDCFGFLSNLSRFMAYYFLCKWISNIQFVYVVIPPVFLKGTFKMKNCLWSRNWKQSVQQFKGAGLMKVSVNYYLRSAMLGSVVCWCLCWWGHLMELRREKVLYPHERKDVISRSRQRGSKHWGGKSSHRCSWEMSVNKWKLLANKWKIKVLVNAVPWLLLWSSLIVTAHAAGCSFRVGGESCVLWCQRICVGTNVYEV